MSARFEPVVGRYMTLDLDGREHRIYVESAGEGTPLLCLHTAGSDTRQWRAVMNDERITRRYRVIAFDLPGHGKSSPPEGWEKEEYRLTSQAYMAAILSVMDALDLDRPVVMGCSIGGRIVLHLALHHAERLKAVIGLQSGAHVEPYYDTGWLHHPMVHGGEVCAGVVSGLIAPTSPDRDRWETLWHYMQSGPGIFKGDLHFYKKDGDIRDALARIDTAACPVHLLTGEYDYSCTPDDTRHLGEYVRGAEVTIMERLGHFPMSENPSLFIEYLLPVLDRIDGR